MKYLFFLYFKGMFLFYKDFDQNFSNIYAVSRNYHFEFIIIIIKIMGKK
jgi:hypothetical protein